MIEQIRDFGARLGRWTLLTIGWLATALSALGALVALFDGLWFITLGFVAVAIAVCPKVPMPADWRPKVVIMALGVLLVGSVMDSSKMDTQRVAERQAALEEQGVANREALEETFRIERDAVLSTMQDALASGDYVPALQASARFRDIADESFMATFGELERRLDVERRAAREADLIAQVRTVPASDRERNRSIYRELMQLEPDNARYAERFNHYDGLIMADERAAAERIARFGEIPQKSAWDGSYRVVTRYLEEIANDPGSIDISACTDVYHVDRGWLVGCDYRGANAFGALIRASNWFIIRQGRVVAMEDASAYNPR